MGYADRFYYGQCKLSVTTSKPNVTINGGGRSFELSGSGTILLPGTNKYTVTAGNVSRDIFVGYGDCKKIYV